jgi:hypothetical protein
MVFIGWLMLRILVSWLLLLAFSVQAEAGVVLWLEEEIPDDKLLHRADVRTGGTGHLAANYLAYPPEPIVQADRDGYALLRKAMDEANLRWDEFEIEQAIAEGLGGVLDQVGIIRDERDRDDVVSTLLFQGAAAHIAFEGEAFRTDAAAEPYRETGDGMFLNRPWLWALAMDPHRIFRSSDMADGASFPALQASQEDIDSLEAGEITLPRLMAGETIVLNGTVQAEDARSVTVQPGRHWLHLMRGGVVHGRAVLEVEPSAVLEYPARVSAEELASAREQVLKGTTTGFPAALKEVMSEIAKVRGEAVYVAARDENAIEVLPYTRGAKLIEQRLVTVVSVGEFGAGLLSSDLFDQTEAGSVVTAPAAYGGVGLEVGISYVSLLAGLDVAITPTYSVTHGNRDLTENITISAWPQPYGGLGVYAIRPTGATPTVLLAGTIGFDFPAFLAYGGRATFGIPIDQQGNWFRFSFGAKVAPRSMWESEDIAASMNTYFFRTGFGSLL